MFSNPARPVTVPTVGEIRRASPVTPRRATAFVFLHGGPGFDSRSARAILNRHLHNRGLNWAFWDEPSRSRPDGDPFDPTFAYERWLASAERFTLAAAGSKGIRLLTHSFSVHAGLEIARRHPRAVCGLVAMAPAADAFRAYCSVLDIAARDFDRIGDDRAAMVRGHLRDTRAVMDEEMQKAFALAAEDDQIFEHYWVNTTAKRRAAEAYGGRFTVDVESFFSVLSDYRDRHDRLHTPGLVTQPVLAVFGDGDVVTPRSDHLAALEARASHLEAVTIPSTGHYLHLEAPEALLDVIDDWIDRTDRDAVRDGS